MKFDKYKAIKLNEGIALRPINGIYQDLNKSEWEKFETFADINTFLCEGAEIGKTYEMDEIEVAWQVKRDNFDWTDTDDPDYMSEFGYSLRQIFRLTQPVEKEPETHKWIMFGECPRCGNCGEVFTKSKEEGWVYDEEEARCGECSLKGIVSVEDSECADIIWDDYEEPETVDQAEYKKITGFDTPAERKAYEEGREDEAKVIFDFIRKWDGKTNSGLGEMLDDKFRDWQKQQSK